MLRNAFEKKNNNSFPMSFIKRKLEEAGLDVYDTPKVIARYLVANKILYVGLITLCYKRKPLFTFCKKYGVEGMLTNRFPKVYTYGKKYYNNKVNKISKSKFYGGVTKFIGLNPKTTIHSILEASLMYKLALPISFPLLMYGSAYPYLKQARAKEKELNESKQK